MNEFYDSIDALPCVKCESDNNYLEVSTIRPRRYRMGCGVCGCRTQWQISECSAVDVWNGGPSHRLALETLRAKL